MNNFRNFSLKYNRNCLERGIISRVKKFYPNVEQYISAHRFPVLPKIVVYSSSASSETFLQKYNCKYSVFFPSTT